MTMQLELEIEEGPLEAMRAEVAVACCFDEDRPLRSDAGRADWRLCGLLSEVLAAGAARGVVLAPSFGRLRAPRLLLLGLGSRKDFGPEVVRAACAAAIARTHALGAGSLAMGMPGEWGGVNTGAAALAQAALRGWLEAAEAQPRGTLVRVVAAPGAGGALEDRLYAALDALRRTDLEIRRRGSPDPRLTPSEASRATPFDGARPPARPAD
jgi:hypothetical protein